MERDQRSVVEVSVRSHCAGRQLWGHHSKEAQFAYRAEFSPTDSDTIIATGGKGVVLMINQTSKVIKSYSGHTQSVFGLAFASDGQTFYTSGDDHLVLQWNIALFKPVWRVSLTNWVVSLLLSNGVLFAGVFDSPLLALDPSNGKVLREYVRTTDWLAGIVIIDSPPVQETLEEAQGFALNCHVLFDNTAESNDEQSEEQELSTIEQDQAQSTGEDANQRETTEADQAARTNSDADTVPQSSDRAHEDL